MPFDLDNPFWQFSLALYKNEEVKALCLHFQEKEGANVNLILFCCWLAYAVEPITEIEFKTACQSITRWQSEVTQLLRRTRQNLKSLAHDEWTINFYQLALANEIKSESYQQHCLYVQFANKLRNTGLIDGLVVKYLSWLFDEMNQSIDDELAQRMQDFICLVQQLNAN